MKRIGLIVMAAVLMLNTAGLLYAETSASSSVIPVITSVEVKIIDGKFAELTVHGTGFGEYRRGKDKVRLLCKPDPYLVFLSGFGSGAGKPGVNYGCALGHVKKITTWEETKIVCTVYRKSIRNPKTNGFLVRIQREGVFEGEVTKIFSYP